ncbi:MAG: hypothetical protein JXA90_13925 [Planctomycetes bacterium]|nr:hypothetical protein [Planctomycetota bacterium]
MPAARLRFWILLSGCLVLAAALSAGFAAGFWLGRRGTRPTEPSLLLPEYSSYWLLRSRDMWEELEVTPEQRRDLDAVLAEHYRGDRELREKLEVLAREAQQRIFRILTDEQRARFAMALERYTEDRIEDETIRELTLLRREIHLGFDQQPEAYQAIFDFGLEKRDIFRRHWKPDARREDFEALGKSMEEAQERLCARMERILSPEQLALYRQLLEQRKPGPSRHRRGKPPPPDEKAPGGRGEEPPPAPSPPPRPE